MLRMIAMCTIKKTHNIGTDEGIYGEDSTVLRKNNNRWAQFSDSAIAAFERLRLPKSQYEGLIRSIGYNEEQ